MARFHRFVHSLASGYALLAFNILYTLASVPLALHFLSTEEFGLWALVTQVCNLNQIVIDLGMSAAVSRILIDHKDDRETTAYGAAIQTGVIVLLVQGALIALVGGLVSYWLPHWMDVPTEHWRIFRLLVIWQCGLLALTFAFRIFTFILHAYQRFDISNYAQLAGFVVGFAAQWISFVAGLGLYSLLVSGAAAMFVVGVIGWWQVGRLHLFPAAGRWGRPNWESFKGMFFYGTDMFLIAIGMQLITASQAPIISRTLGLEAVAVWSVATKLFMLSQQLVYRLLDFSLAAFSEMIVRGETARLQARFRDLIILSGSASAALGLTMALCNRAFLSLWTHDRLAWPVENDLLMACSLMVYASTRCHIGLACITKKIGALKYVYFAEALGFIGFGLLGARSLGLSGVILAGIATNLLLSGAYGVRRSTQYLQLHAREIVFQWLRPPALVTVAVLIAAVVVRYLTRTLAPLPQLIVCGAIMTPVAGLCFWQLGLPPALRREGWERLMRLRMRLAGG